MTTCFHLPMGVQRHFMEKYPELGHELLCTSIKYRNDCRSMPSFSLVDVAGIGVYAKDCVSWWSVSNNE